MNPESRFQKSPTELFQHAEFLSQLARALVGDEHQAADLAQDAYVAALERPPRESAALGGWLGRVLRNRAFNQRRGEARRSERERQIARPERTRGDAPDEALERMEWQRRVFEAVLALPEVQRTAIYLRYYEGLSPSAIAEQIGAPVKTVKTRLSRGLVALRAQLDERVEGGRDAWLAGIAPLTGAARAAGELSTSATEGSAQVGASSATAVGALGGVAMKSVLVGCVLVVAAWVRWQSSETSSFGSGVTPSSAGAEGLASSEPTLGGDRDDSRAGAADGRSALDVGSTHTASEAALGGLQVRLLWHDGTPAGGVQVKVKCRGAAVEREAFVRALTDERGSVQFAELTPGEISIFLGHGYVDHDRQIVAGETTIVEWRLPEGLEVRGNVVDGEGTPVPDAEIWLEAPHFRWPDGVLVARADDAGSFEVSGIHPVGKLGARGAGFQPSVAFRAEELPAGPQGEREVTLVLGASGGGIQGRVVDPAGHPVAGARVHAGARGGYSVDGPDGRRGEAPRPAPVTTDADGAFLLPGGYANGVPIHAQAPGFPTWSGHVSVPPGETAQVLVRLESGAMVEGTVLDTEGRPAVNATVLCSAERNGGWYELVFPPPSVRADAEGRYRMELVPPGPQQLVAKGDAEGLGRAYRGIDGVAGEVTQADLVLDPHPLVAGRVVDAEGSPLVGWRVSGSPAPPNHGRWYPRQDQTDDGGAFSLANVGEYTLRLEAYAPDTWGAPRAETLVEPGTEGVEIVVDQLAPPMGYVSGEVREMDGSIPVDAKLAISSEADKTRGQFVEFDSESGAFHHGPIDAGRYTLRLSRGTGTALVSDPFEIEAARTIDVGLLRVGAGGYVELTVGGIPLELVGQLRLRLDRDHCESVYLEPSGERLVSGEIAPGEWTLMTHERELYVWQQIEVVSAETQIVHVELERAFSLELELEFETPDWKHLVARVTDPSDRLLERRSWSVTSDRLFEQRTWTVTSATPPLDVRFDLPLGPVQVEFETDTGSSATAAFEVGADIPPDDRRLRLR